MKLRLLFADLQKMFLLPLILVGYVLFFYQGQIRQERIIALHHDVVDLEERLSRHEQISGHTQMIKEAAILGERLKILENLLKELRKARP